MNSCTWLDKRTLTQTVYQQYHPHNQHTAHSDAHQSHHTPHSFRSHIPCVSCESVHRLLLVVPLFRSGSKGVKLSHRLVPQGQPIGTAAISSRMAASGRLQLAQEADTSISSAAHPFWVAVPRARTGAGHRVHRAVHCNCWPGSSRKQVLQLFAAPV